MKNLKAYFDDRETFLSPEFGYQEKNVFWFESYILPDFISLFQNSNIGCNPHLWKVSAVL